MAAGEIPDLWGGKIDLIALSPVAILNAQAGMLSRRTSGLLTAEVLRRRSDGVDTPTPVVEDGSVVDALSPQNAKLFYDVLFDLKAPALSAFRERIAVVRHKVGKVYPAIVTAVEDAGLQSGFTPSERGEQHEVMRAFELAPKLRETSAVAFEQDEFIGIIGRLLSSRVVRGTIQSLIAKSNEATRMVRGT